MNKSLDLTTGPLVRKIYIFAIPLALTGMLQQLFNAADVAIVGRFAGDGAMAAVGTNGQLVSLIINLFLGLALGTNVVVARAIGSRQNEIVKKAVHTSILLALAGGVLMTLVVETLAVPIVSVLKVPEEIFPLAVLYFRVYMAGLPVIFLYNFEAAVFRADGDTKTPLIVLTIAGILNVLLNAFFVIVLKMTVDGVALATVISNLLCAAALFVLLLKTERSTRVRLKDLKIDLTVMSQILRIGIPSGIQSAMFNIANVLIQSAINSLGTIVMAGSAAAASVESMAYFVLNSFNQTCTTFVGQNYGAGKPDRCRRVLKDTLLHAILCAGTVCAVMLLLSGPLMSLFTTDPEVAYWGKVRLTFFVYSVVFSACNEMGSGYLRGFGLSSIPAVVAVITICGTRIFWISTIFRMSPTFQTIFWVYPVSLFLCGATMMTIILILRPSRKIKEIEADHEE